MAKELIILVDKIHAPIIESVLKELPRSYISSLTKTPITNVFQQDSNRQRYTLIVDNTTGQWLVDAFYSVGIGNEQLMPNSLLFSSNLNEITNYSTEDDEDLYYEVETKLSVRELWSIVKNGSTIDVTFYVLIVVASIIAAAGLASNSGVSVIASMLVSPLMGPILGLTFGTVIKDWRLVRLGAFGAIVGIVLCIVVGFISGAVWIPCTTGVELPFQMTSRGAVSGFISGFFVASASGVGVAWGLSVEGVNSLVGVAISASLLPPLVNCGMFLALAMYPTYIQDYSCKQLLLMGLYSFLLSAINIACIFVFGAGTFWVQKIASKGVKKKMDLLSSTVSEMWSKQNNNTMQSSHEVNKTINLYKGTPIENLLQSTLVVSGHGLGSKLERIDIEDVTKDYIERLQRRIETDKNKYENTDTFMGGPVSMLTLQERFRKRSDSHGEHQDEIRISRSSSAVSLENK